MVNRRLEIPRVSFFKTVTRVSSSKWSFIIKKKYLFVEENGNLKNIEKYPGKNNHLKTYAQRSPLLRIGCIPLQSFSSLCVYFLLRCSC